MRRIVFFLALLAVTAQTFAQDSGSSLRKAYEKEKNGPHGDCAVKWRRLQPGLDYRSITCLGDEDDLDLHVVRVDLDVWGVDGLMTRARARSVARSKDTPFAINANFFDKAGKPIGLIVSSGEILRPPNPSGWQSIFLLRRNGTARIIMPSSWPSYDESTWMAVQAGPRLVIDGHSNQSIKNNYAAERCGVCIKKNGDLLFFANPTGRKLHIKEIARVARRGEGDGGLACRNAMLFDGGHSVNFFAEGEDKRVSIEGDPVPVFVYITSKKQISQVK